MGHIQVEMMDKPAIKAALDKAQEAIGNWTVYSGDEKAKENLLVGWSGWSLAEEIAWKILEGQGYDMEALEDCDELVMITATGGG